MLRDSLRDVVFRPTRNRALWDPLGSGRITHEVRNAVFEIDGLASTLSFDVFPSPHADVNLGLLWLQRVNPTIHWSAGTLSCGLPTIPPMDWLDTEDKPVSAIHFRAVHGPPSGMPGQPLVSNIIS